MRVIIAIVVFFTIYSNASAQNHKSPTYHKRDGKIAAIGLNMGYYRPILFYYNSIYLENSGFQLDGGVSFGGVLDYYVKNGIYIRAGLDFSSQSLVTKDVSFRDRNRNDTFGSETIHASLLAYYEIDFTRRVKPYVGLGMGIMKGEMDHSISYENFDTVYVNTGYPVYGIAVGGMNYMLTEELDVGLELRLYWPAHHSEYNTVDLGGTPTTLSYAGPSGYFRIAYRFDSMINRDRLDVRRGGKRMRRARGR